MTLAEKITAIREKRGWNMSKLAKVSDIPQPTIWRLEKGIIAEPRTRILQQLAEALGVSTDYLLREEDTMSFDELLRNDELGQAVFRGYEALNAQNREQVESFVRWLMEEEKKRPEQD
ncbi:MAG: helix-turn-helix transcriptional regulator [Pseudomonadota bacterium]